MSNNIDRVVPLDQLADFTVADGDPDVRGWKVLASDGETVGMVDELLVDTAERRVRYLDIDVGESGFLDIGSSNRHVAIPIGQARLERDNDRVVLEGIRSREIESLPEFTGTLDRDSETVLRQRFDPDFKAAVTDSDQSFYTGDLYDERRFYGRHLQDEDEVRVTRSEEELAIGTRERVAGEVMIETLVDTEHVRETVPLMREEVTIERRPIESAMAAGEARIEEDSVRIPLMQEEAVVEKRTVATEELVVNKREVIEEEIVEADLRKERIDVNRPGIDSDGNAMR